LREVTTIAAINKRYVLLSRLGAGAAVA
jgi:hypothetical protein